jgi:uncharacterized membrane protein YphA (DoxX/SURF4 family)
MTGLEPLAYLAVRLFTSASWIAAGIHNTMHFEKTVEGIADHGIPLPRLVLPIVLLMDFGGAALLLADQCTWAVCLVWIAFLFLATYFYHLRWVTPAGEFDLMQYTQLWKNVSMVGGLIAVILLDPSRPDWLLRG